MIRSAFLHAFDWTGRARRREIWAYAGFAFLMLAGCVVAEVWLSAASPRAPRWVYLSGAVLLVPLIGLGVRRLRDRGHAGGWMALAFVPGLGGLVWAYLFLAPSETRADAPDTPLMLHLLGAGLTAALVLLVASRVLWAPYWVSSGSMKPGLLAGDVVIARFAQADDLDRGDVVVFRAGRGGATQAARLVGLPGDTVQMQAGRIVLNGTPVPQTAALPFSERYVPQGPLQGLPRCGNAPVGTGGTCTTARLQETLPGGRSHTVLDLMTAGPADDTAAFSVPEGQLFVLGDNRDDSLDSRFAPAIGGLGLVAADDVIGRAARVAFSADGVSLAAVWTWRPDRFWQAVP